MVAGTGGREPRRAGARPLARAGRGAAAAGRPSTEDLWPADVTPDLTDVDVAIARTVPGSDAQPAIRECEALFLDSIAAGAASDLHRKPVLHERQRLRRRWRRGCANPTAPRSSSSRRRNATAGSSRTRWARFATTSSGS